MIAASTDSDGCRDGLSLFMLADQLGVAPPVVKQLVERGGLPVMLTGGRWLFQPALVNRWLDLCMSGLRDVDVRALAGGNRNDGVSLAVALDPANVLLDLPLSGCVDLMRQVAGALHLPADVDRSRILDGLLAREQWCSTALGHGFAVPHTARISPRLVKEHTVAFVRARRAIPFAPTGGELTDLFLFVFAADELAHLQLLARSTSLARSLALSQALRAASNAEEVIRLLRNEEQRAFGSEGYQ